MSEKAEASRLVYHRVHIGLKYATLRFPLDPRELAQFLPEKGWIIPSAIVELPLGGALRGEGLLARKASSQVTWNADAQVIAVAGRNPENVAEDFEQVEAVIEHDIGYDSAAHALFYELVAEALVRTKTEPINSVRALGEKMGLLSLFEKAIHSDVSLFGLRLAPSKGGPEDSEWYEVNVSPLVFHPRKHLSVQVVWRSKERADVMTATKQLSDLIARITATLEERHE